MTSNSSMPYDVLIVGGGPAGLAAALALGRARKRVLVCDSGPRRNAAAERIHNFVTRDGTPPDDFRTIAREQLGAYASVEFRGARVEEIGGSKGAFRAVVDSEIVEARRVLLCVGMIDELLPIAGFSELWGSSIFQCPYCHGFEVQNRPWGYLARAANSSHLHRFALQARGWTRDLVVFTQGEFEVPDETLSAFGAAKIRVETAPVIGLIGDDQGLVAVELSNGSRVPCEILFCHPPQRQVDLVNALGLALDDNGFVQIDPMLRGTSVPGIYAAGDLTTGLQGAILAAASGTHAAAGLNMELTMELATSGTLA